MPYYLFDKAGRKHAAEGHVVRNHNCPDCPHTAIRWVSLCGRVKPDRLNFADGAMWSGAETGEAHLAATPTVVAGDSRVQCKRCHEIMEAKP